MSKKKHDVKALEALDALYEFEREPVTEDKLQPGRYFAGMFAGEHVAGTEFVIGVTFVSWGVSAFDVFVGLAIGNLLAVLTWTFICAPIAVRTRLTLYWYLRKIAGPGVTLIYNLWNAFMFCILAGCMITVSASAVRIPFGIPPNTEWYPEDYRFVLVVLAVGAVVVTLAILGFKRLSQFAVVCSPWMFLMFVAGAVVLLPLLVREHSGSFWELFNQYIWIGERPDGSAKISFMEVAAFAWVCNLAMHGGLSDMAIFRYAKSHWYGLYTGFGMFFGHYIAWICAGMMGAITVIMLKSGNAAMLTSVSTDIAANMARGGLTLADSSIKNIDPGAMAYNALGISGIIAVILAGWTTSNPTLYRAGLAIQAITPNWPRWIVTLVVGALTTIVACFPFVFTWLLNFVGLYGLLLVPIGAIVFAEHWIFPLIGFTQLWCEKKKLLISWPAMISWLAGLGFALALFKLAGVSLFFLFIPTCAVTMVLYIGLAAVMGARETYPEEPAEVHKPAPQKSAAKAAKAVAPVAKGPDFVLRLCQAVAILSLAVCLIWPFVLYLQGGVGYEERLAVFRTWVLLPTLTYFIAGTCWAIKTES